MMEFGQGFVVMLGNKESEDRLLQMLSRQQENYPIVSASRIRPLTWLITSLDGVFLHLESTKDLEGLHFSVRPANPGDSTDFEALCRRGKPAEPHWGPLLSPGRG